MRNYKEFLPEFVWPALGLSPWRSWGGGSLFCGGFFVKRAREGFFPCEYAHMQYVVITMRRD